MPTLYIKNQSVILKNLQLITTAVRQNKGCGRGDLRCQMSNDNVDLTQAERVNFSRGNDIRAKF